ncbi:MAG TPA: ubiquinol-cytochrome c reductase iron-sulfur subunit [bacterium]|nr:ubiquinol-cytochrome c reductase iron-sulfur subunit [bacterium]
MSDETPEPNMPEPAKPTMPVPPVKPPPPVPPQTPPAAKPAGGPASPERRHFLFTWLGLAWVAFAAATAAALSTVLRFMFPNVLFEPKMSFKAGVPDDYETGKVDERWKEKYGVWVVRTTEELYALSTICTHLGCTPNWLDAEQKFKCPCHGSGFYKTGINFEGPAPRPLERYAISLTDEGHILVDKSKIFQQEKGEWTNPASFIAL